MAIMRLYHPVWKDFIDPGFDAHDLVDGNISNLVEVTGKVDYLSPGEYLLKYQVADLSGNLAIPKTRTVIVTNQAPFDILLSNQLIDENSPIGTEVGSLVTLDPDDLEKVKNYKYTLLKTDNLADSAPFMIDGNGTLRTTRVLDWESQNSFEINIQSMDEFGSKVEKTSLFK